MKRTLALSLLAALAASAVAVRPAHAQAQEAGPPKIIHKPNPHEIGLAPSTGGTASTSPILYHGGPVIATPTVYLIWYGNWNQSNGSDTPSGQQIVRDFAKSVGGSPYFDINASYNGVTGGVTVPATQPETTDAYSHGSRIGDSGVQAIVTNAISSGKLPYDASGVYFVLTSSDVSERSGFCTRYCGWHTAANSTVGHIRYSFVGNANRCLNACAAQTVGPNGNAGVDGMVSVIAHELEETTTDPDLNAWYDGSGAENADKCAWTFGHAQYQVSNGAWANMLLGSRNYLIQRNLDHNIAGANGVGDYCMVNSTQN
jgi:hypothetical protein